MVLRCLFSCPAYALDPGQLARLDSARLAELADQLGAEAQLAATATETLPKGSWHPAEQRLAELAQLADCEFWWPLRGGYGCVHLLPGLARLPIKARLIGFSDCTALHALWQGESQPESYHAAMPNTPPESRSLTSLQTLVRGMGWEQSVPEGRILVAGEAQGPAFAACLSVLAGLVGTPWMPDLAGRILLLEDIDERPYTVDRRLWQLHTAGCLDGLAGLVFGPFPWQRAPGSSEPSMGSIHQTWAERIGVPCVTGLPIGHITDPLSIAQDRPSTLLPDTGSGWCWRQSASSSATSPA